MKRRTVLASALSGTAVALAPSLARAQKATDTIIDTNVSLYRWPFRRLPLDDADKLVKKLRSLNIGQAWAGSFESILKRDMGSVNQRVADLCRKYPELIPVGSINLSLSQWESDFRRCVDIHRMPVIRLHPNYHGYTLDDPRLARLLKLAAQAGVLVQIVPVLEDIRTQNPQLVTTDADLSPLPALIKSIADVRVQLLNWRPRLAQMAGLAETPRLFFDTARVDGTDGVARIMNALPPGRVLFGSHSPFLVPEASLIRVAESRLEEKQLRSVLRDNAERLIQLPA